MEMSMVISNCYGIALMSYEILSEDIKGIRLATLSPANFARNQRVMNDRVIPRALPDEYFIDPPKA